MRKNKTLYRTEKYPRPEIGPKIGESVTKDRILALWAPVLALSRLKIGGPYRAGEFSKKIL